MSKVDSLTSEPAAGLDRRGLLAAAGGVAVAGVLPTAALALPVPVAAGGHSPEFLRWRDARAAYDSAQCAQEAEHKRVITPYAVAGMPGYYGQGVVEAIQRDAAHREADSALHEATYVLDTAIEALKARPVRTVQDIADLAEMVWRENGWAKDDPDNDDLPLHLTAVYEAIMTLAGGAHV